MTARASTARIRSAKRDMAWIAAELKWLSKNLPDLDVIGFSRDVRPEMVQSGTREYESRVLVDEGRAEVRAAVLDAVRALNDMAKAMTATRVKCEQFFGGPSEDYDATGVLITPAELRALRARQQVRVANEGDCRFGEWEATPQPAKPKTRGT